MTAIDTELEPNRRILIVDDNRAIHEDISKVLAGTSGAEAELETEEAFLFGTESLQTVLFEIASAFQGQEGLQKVEAALAEGRPYALAFVDIRMPPGWDGIETVRHLWKADPGLQVVICTAYSDYSWSDMHRRLGSSENLVILKKPFDNVEVTQLAHALTTKWTVTRRAEVQTSRLQAELISRTLAEQAMRVSQERYALAARGSNDGIWDWDLVNRAIYFAPRWKEMLGYPEDEVEPRLEAWLHLVHPDDRERLRVQLEAHSKLDGPNDFISEHRVCHKDGSWRWMLNRAAVLRSEAGVAIRMAGSQTDVTKNKAFDSLTSLPNRVLFIEAVARALELGRNESRTLFGVMFIDLDSFKDINDTLGHSAGDQLLIEVARRLERVVRYDSEHRHSPGLVARIGGDEFAVLVGCVTSHEEATGLADEIQRTLNQPYDLRSNSIVIGASIGIAVWQGSYSTPGEMLQDADTAMYRAKKRGRSRCVLFDADMRADSIRRIELEADLRLALTRKELVVVYQPIFHLSPSHSDAIGHRLSAIEALVRWRHPSRGLLMPRDFIHLAEETGLIVQLGDYVLREACSSMKRWHEMYPSDNPVDLAVNLSPSQLHQANFVSRISAVLDDTGFNPRHLKLEITEAVLIDDFPSVQASINSLKEMGIEFEIDDFGTGYSCLSWLPALRCKSLKIDRSFVLGMMDDAHSLEIVRATIGLAQNLKMNVIAEGIETKTQLDILRSLGCHFGQGYYLSRPLSMEAAERAMSDSAVEANEAGDGSCPSGLDFSAFQMAKGRLRAVGVKETAGRLE